MKFIQNSTIFMSILGTEFTFFIKKYFILRPGTTEINRFKQHIEVVWGSVNFGLQKAGSKSKIQKNQEWWSFLIEMWPMIMNGC